MQYIRDISVIPLEQDLDVSYAPRFKLELERLIDSGTKRIIINMVGATYIDSAGMGVLVTEARRLRAAGGLLSLANTSEQVEHALQTARLLGYIPAQSAKARTSLPKLSPSVEPYWRRTIKLDELGLSGARHRLDELLSQLKFTSVALFDFSLACGEAMGNAIDHASGQGALATVIAYPDRAIVQVSDCGAGFDQEKAARIVPTSRGRGLKLMKLLADDVQICEKVPGPGTLVCVTKLY